MPEPVVNQVIETSVPHNQWQNGVAERLGGYIIEGGRALQFGGYLPESYWFRCVKAFSYIRNRMPNSKTHKDPRQTPFGIWEDVVIPLKEQMAPFRVIGSLCHVVYGPTDHRASQKSNKRTWKGIYF
jgi:hypothetical protein